MIGEIRWSVWKQIVFWSWSSVVSKIIFVFTSSTARKCKLYIACMHNHEQCGRQQHLLYKRRQSINSWITVTLQAAYYSIFISFFLVIIYNFCNRKAVGCVQQPYETKLRIQRPNIKWNTVGWYQTIQTDSKKQLTTKQGGKKGGLLHLIS